MLFNAKKGLWSRNVLWLFYIFHPKMFVLTELFLKQSFNYCFYRCYSCARIRSAGSFSEETTTFKRLSGNKAVVWEARVSVSAACRYGARRLHPPGAETRKPSGFNEMCLIDFDCSIAPLSLNTFSFLTLFLFWYVSFLLNLRFVVWVNVLVHHKVAWVGTKLKMTERKITE